MVRQARLHRLPQRLDYTLVPAPLDLSLPQVTEKSPLPAIIVTPSSPVSTHDFAIAFLAPPQKQSLRTRLAAYSPRTHTRAFFFVLLILFILICHVVTHSLASTIPHFQFAVQSDTNTRNGWLQGLGSFFDIGVTERAHADFVVTEGVGLR